MCFAGKNNPATCRGKRAANKGKNRRSLFGRARQPADTRLHGFARDNGEGAVRRVLLFGRGHRHQRRNLHLPQAAFVNHGDSPNKLSLVIWGRELTGQAALVYATLAVRVCLVVSTDGSDTPDSAPAVEVGEWFYLCDFCTLAEGVASFGSVTPFGDYLLPGVEDLATSGDTSGSPSGDLYGTGAVENVCDLWLQVELLPCAELEQNEKFKALNITEAPYQAMQGMDNAFELDFSVFFEVDV